MKKIKAVPAFKANRIGLIHHIGKRLVFNGMKKPLAPGEFTVLLQIGGAGILWSRTGPLNSVPSGCFIFFMSYP